MEKNGWVIKHPSNGLDCEISRYTSLGRGISK